MVLKDFLKFLREYKVVSLAIAFVMGTASTALINSFVKDILMPVVLPLSSGSWRDAVFAIGPMQIRYGAFLAELLNFLALASVVFLVARRAVKDEKNNKER